MSSIVNHSSDLSGLDVAGDSQGTFPSPHYLPHPSLGDLEHSDQIEMPIHMEESRLGDHASFLNEETIAFTVPPDVEDQVLGHEEVFSYSPHVEGSGFQNQPSYDEAPNLSKHDMTRYAMTYK